MHKITYIHICMYTFDIMACIMLYILHSAKSKEFIRIEDTIA